MGRPSKNFRRHYNLLDLNGNVVLSNVMQEDIKNYTGVTCSSLNRYVLNHYTFGGKYKIVEINANENLPINEFEKEWNKVVGRFNNVIWVKAGGKRLLL